MYHKRTAGRIAGVEIPKKALTGFLEVGSTVEFLPRLDVRDPGACGNHTVRASELLEDKESAAIKHSSEKIDDLSVASQMRSGEGSGGQFSCERAGDVSHAQRPQARAGKSIRVVISKQQLAKLLAGGYIKQSAGCRARLPQNANVGNMAQLISNAMTLPGSPGPPWSPRLDTVAEVDVISWLVMQSELGVPKLVQFHPSQLNGGRYEGGSTNQISVNTNVSRLHYVKYKDATGHKDAVISFDGPLGVERGPHFYKASQLDR